MRLGRRLWASALVRFAVAALAIAVAAWTIRMELRAVHLAAVLEALRATPPWAVVLAAVLTASSHAGLAMVEWFALKAIGQAQPLRPTLLRAFTANALSSLVGFGLASGGALRFRLYKDAGLEAPEIARLVFVTTAATWLSGVVALGLGLLVASRPVAAALHLPPVLVQAAGVLLLAPAALWCTAFRGDGKSATLTRPGRAAALLAGLGDWLFSGAALFVLTARSIAGLPQFLTIFCLGSLLGGLLGAPGGVGVLDAAVLGLHRSLQAHATAAALILYRVIYLLGPAAIALLILAARRVVRR